MEEAVVVVVVVVTGAIASSVIKAIEGEAAATGTPRSSRTHRIRYHLHPPFTAVAAAKHPPRRAPPPTSPHVNSNFSPVPAVW